MLLTVDLDRLRLKAGETLLDAGCGEGRHCFGALARGAPVLAVDPGDPPLPAGIERLRARAEEVLPAACRTVGA